MLSRRKALITLATTLMGATGLSWYQIVNSPPTGKLPEIPGKIPLDAHSHFLSTDSYHDLASRLNWGATVITARNDKREILRYGDLTGFNGFKEIEKGVCGQFTYQGSTGYILAGQEIASDHHIVGIGLREILPNYDDARQAIEEVQKRGGIAILAHPFLISWHGVPILVGQDELSRITELCQQANEFEVFNAQALPLFLYNLNEANNLAKTLEGIVGPSGFPQKGIAVSDGHITEQSKAAATYFKAANFSFEALKHYIAVKDFIVYRRHVSFGNAVKGLIQSSLAD